MKIIFADFNARTVSGDVRLNCRGSVEDMREKAVRVGDWTWLTDGELVVGAEVVADGPERIFGVPHWKTLVHLDDDDVKDPAIVIGALRDLLGRSRRDEEDEARVFQLLTIIESIAPPDLMAALPPGDLALRRAGVLHLLGEPELALVEIEQALDECPGDGDIGYFRLETLRRVDPARAAREAEEIAGDPEAPAPVLAACINALASAADRATDGQFEGVGPRVLDWIERFERAPGRDAVRASVLAQVQFNRGLVLLRLDRRDEAREALTLAHATDPAEPTIGEAIGLDAFDDRAREIAARFRARPIRVAA